jgi:hypothetical protein
LERLPAPFVPSAETIRIERRRTFVLWGLVGVLFTFGLTMLQLNEFAFAEAALATCLVASVHEIGKRETMSVKIAAYFVVILFFGFWAIDTYKIKADKPWSNIAGSGRATASDFTVVSFQRGRYEAEKLAIVNVFYRYEGSDNAKAQGAYFVLEMMMKAAATPEDIASAEETAWKAFEPNAKLAPEMQIPPKSNIQMTAKTTYLLNLTPMG